MKVGIHQPNYLPWIGYIGKICLSDVFVLLDTVQFPKNNIVNRNRIRTRQGWEWLTIPIDRQYYGRPIRNVRLPQTSTWWQKHWNTIVANYGKADFFQKYKDFFQALYTEKRFNLLPVLNESIIQYLLESFHVKTEVVRASELPVDPELRKTELIVEILGQVGGSTYLSGVGARKYQDEDRIKAQGIELAYLEYHPTPYPQRWPGFEPNLSAIDLLFNLGGVNARSYLDGFTTIART